MKHQYFGDINDFQKYRLLRSVRSTGLQVLAAWMLTQDDGRTDGRFTSYLGQPSRYRDADPELFDALAAAVRLGHRDLRVIEESGLLDMRFFGAYLDDPELHRDQYFEELWQSAAGSDVIFFDPDNGVEVMSVARTSRSSCKYIYWSELGEAVARGHSVLAYQHFPRIHRATFLARVLDEIEARFGLAPSAVYTSRVAFFAISQPPHGDALNRALNEAVVRSRGSMIGWPRRD